MVNVEGETMDQPSDKPNDNPFQPEEEATFNEAATESTGASTPTPSSANPFGAMVSESPFASNNPEPQADAPAPAVNEADANPVVAAPAAEVQQDAVANTPVTPETPAEPLVIAAPKKKKRWVPIAIAGGALVLLGGGASAYYFGVYQNPDNVLYDAYSHMVSSKATQMSGSVSFDMPVMSGIKLKSIDYSGNFENNPSATMNITAKMVVMSADIAVGGKGIMADGGDMYFQLTGLVDAFKSYVQAAGSSAGDVPDSFYTALAKLQDQWVKVSVDDMKTAGAETGAMYQCVIDAYKKHKDDSTKPVLEAYKSHSFLVKKDDLGTKDGRIGYKLGIDMTKAKEFSKAVADTDLAKDMKNCSSSGELQDINDTVDSSAAGADATLNVWIDQWSHELKSVKYNGTMDDSTTKITYNGTMDMGYSSTVTTKAPDSSISMEEYGKRFEDVMNSTSETTLIDDTVKSASNTL